MDFAGRCFTGPDVKNKLHIDLCDPLEMGNSLDLDHGMILGVSTSYREDCFMVQLTGDFI